MREPGDVFHLAIPARDLDEAQDFYVNKLGCHLARRYDDRITLDFFGDQVVCHLTDQVIEQTSLYPHHFGITFRNRSEFDALLHCAKLRGLEFFRDCETRFAGMIEEHLLFVLRDPTGNLLEFKHYHDPRMMY